MVRLEPQQANKAEPPPQVGYGHPPIAGKGLICRGPPVVQKTLEIRGSEKALRSGI